MNEQEKNAFNGEESPVAGDDLTKELEQLRDLFQKELDLAEENAAEQEPVIQDTEDTASFEEEESDAPLCECCEENRADRSFGEDYPYCKECRELMKHYPLRKRGVVALLAMILVFCLSVYYGADSFEKTIEVLDAKILADSGKNLTLLNELYSRTSDTDPDSEKLVELLVDALCNTGYIRDASNYIQNIFTPEELEKPSNKKYKDIVEATERFDATQIATEDIVYPAFSGNAFDYDEVAAELDAIAESYINEEQGIKYEAILTNYYKYELMQLAGKDAELQLETLKAIEASDESGIYHWIYNAPLCELYGMLGDKESADAYFDKMMQKNCEDMLAYKAYSAYYRFLETPDADGMIALCEEAEKNAPSGDASYMTVLATAYLIKGEGALAYETMQQYMASGRYSVPDCNLYALCALYCGNTETYETMKSTLEGSGYHIAETVEKYKDGEMSLAEVIADKRGDIG